MASSLLASILISIAVCTFAEAADASSSSLSRERESQALMDFGWPYINSTADHCEWKGITCDAAGRVQEMSLHQKSFKPGTEFDSLDMLAFPDLKRIHLPSCALNGFIPDQIGFLSKLTYLNLSHNLLYTDLPLSLANLTELQVLDISYNFHIYGPIPPVIGSLSNLTYLSLSNDRISSDLPLSFANLTKLVYLDLSNNNITGSLPSSISMSLLTRLEFLKLGVNKLEGYFEAGIEKLPSIKTLGLSRSSISGQIPSQFGDVVNAKSLDIDLSYNNLSGQVPESLSHLSGINLAYNHNLEGRIPPRVWRKFRKESFVGNPNLLSPKGSTIRVEKPKLRSKLKIILPVATFFGCVFVFSIYFICFRKREKIADSVIPDPRHGDMLKIWNFDGRIAYRDIVEATAGFDRRYCIGYGGCGRVYKAELPGGKVVAVKKLRRFKGENTNFEKRFRKEAKVLSEIRHRNIVKLFGYCLHNKSMFLIYDYKERGS